MLKVGNGYHELGDAFLDRIDERMVAANIVHRLRRLCYTVHLEREDGLIQPAL